MIIKALLGCAGIAFIIIFTAATGQSSNPAPPPPQQAAKAGFTNLAVNDDFSKFDLHNPDKDPTYWHIYPFRLPINDDLIFYKDRVLNLVTPPHGTATMIKTLAPDYSQHHFGFGYYEARLRFNPTQYDAPSFYLESDNPVKIQGRPDADPEETRFCEIDIMELNYTRPGQYMATVHDWYQRHSTYNHPNIFQPPPGTDLSAWNTFGVLWQPGKITWYVNDKFVYSTTAPAICDRQGLNLVLSSAKNNRLLDSPDQLLQVNWVRVYQ